MRSQLINLSKKIMIAFVSMGFNSMIFAAPSEKVQALNTMKKYVEATSCWHSFELNSKKPTTRKDVYPVYSDAGLGVSEFYVLWSGDKGCSHGGEANPHYMSRVERVSYLTPFIVQDNHAFGDININFKFIEHVKQLNKNKFEIVSWNYADEHYGGKDRSYYEPANKFKYTVEREEFAPWRITNQLLLRQNK